MSEFCEEYFLESPKGRCLACHVRVNFPEYYDEINKLPGIKFSEKLYRYFHPEPSKCVVCGRPTRFNSFTQGYFKYCSNKCATISDERNKKIKKSTLERYGVENVSQSDIIKKKKKDTFREHYGDVSAFQLENTRNTIKNRYGVENVSQSDIIKKKKKETLIKHYGSYDNAKLEMYNSSSRTKLLKYGDPNYINKEKIERTSLERYGFYNHAIAMAHENNPDLISSQNRIWLCKCPHPECTKCHERCYKTKTQLYNDRKRNGCELCTILNPANTNESWAEIEIRNYLDSLDVAYKTNVRDVITPLELDIYIPSKNLAIEYNGCYWHSDSEKDKKYHYNKYIRCKELGIQLIQIWEDWWINKKDIVKSIISSKLGVYNIRIGARKCTIQEVSSQDSIRFENENHIQSTSRSKYKYGLYYNGELVSLMTFGKPRICLNSKNQDNVYELVRFCNKHGYQVIGGASKLFKFFVSKHNPAQVVSFSSNDISVGKLYNLLGFEKQSESISYWYIDNVNFNRYHRYTFTKSRIIKKGLAKSDDNLTEYQMMRNNGYMRIYDSGVTKWIWKV